jgi:hypothetical protein
LVFFPIFKNRVTIESYRGDASQKKLASIQTCQDHNADGDNNLIRFELLVLFRHLYLFKSKEEDEQLQENHYHYHVLQSAVPKNNPYGCNASFTHFLYALFLNLFSVDLKIA